MVDPILTAVATTLAGRAAGGLAELVRKAFARHAEPTAALDAATGAGPDSPEVAELAESLATVEAADPAFGTALREEWARHQSAQFADHGGVTNQISGTVTGRVVQARDITGDITF